jgi:hypothetical protein
MDNIEFYELLIDFPYLWKKEVIMIPKGTLFFIGTEANKYPAFKQCQTVWGNKRFFFSKEEVENNSLIFRKKFE